MHAHTPILSRILPAGVGGALGSLLWGAAGAGVAVAAAYLLTRTSEKRSADERLERLEKMIADLEKKGG